MVFSTNRFQPIGISILFEFLLVTVRRAFVDDDDDEDDEEEEDEDDEDEDEDDGDDDLVLDDFFGCCNDESVCESSLDE